MLLLSQRPLGTSDADHRLFIDRASELARVRRALELGLNVYVHGPPGIGRTTFLRQLQRESAEARYVSLSRFDSMESRLDAVQAALTGASVAQHQGESLGAAMGRTVAAVSGNVIRSIEDPLRDLRTAASGATQESPHVLLVDDLPREDCQQFFGRLRDDMWEIPIRWIVAGTVPYLDPPADSFFEEQLDLSQFDRSAFREMAVRRAASGTPDERKKLLRAARAVAASVTPCTPRRAISVLRDIYLTDEIADVSKRVAELQASRAGLKPTAVKVLDALSAHGPTHAGDGALLASLGVSRSRVVQILGELESKGLVSGERVGRRKLYTACRELPDPAALSGTLGSEDTAVAARLPLPERTNQDTSSEESESRTVP